MDFVETILQSCNSLEYGEAFKKHGVQDSFTFKILTEEDLKIIVGDNQEVIRNILKTIDTLQIPTEKYVDRIVNKQYIEIVLSQMNLHLHKHLANLAIVARREDTIVCDVKLQSTALCLNECLNSLEKTLDEFDKTILSKKKNKLKANVVIPALLISGILLFCVKKFAT